MASKVTEVSLFVVFVSIFSYASSYSGSNSETRSGRQLKASTIGQLTSSPGKASLQTPVQNADGANRYVSADSGPMETLLAVADSTYSGKPDSKRLVSVADAEKDEREMDIDSISDGRPAPQGTDKNSRKQSRRTRRSRARNSNAMLERLAATPGFVDKPAEEEGVSVERRRTPRMASLNAAAKVNLFFEPSSPLAGRSMVEIQEHAKPRVEKRHSNSDLLVRHSDAVAFGQQVRSSEGGGFFQHEISSTSSELFDLSERGSDGGIQDFGSDDSEVFEENGAVYQEACKKRHLEADSTSERVKIPRRSSISDPEPRESSKNGDAEALEIDEFFESDMECDTTTISPPKTMVDACIQVDLPKPATQSNVKHVRVLSVPIRGQLVTSSGSFPFTKQHMVTPVTPVKPPPELTVSKATSTKRAAGLNAKAMMNAMLASNGPLSKYKSMGNLMGEGARSKAKFKEGKFPLAPLKIPKINFAATSTSTFSAGRSRPAGNPVKSIQLKNLNIDLERLVAARKEKSEPRAMQRTNGWIFVGESLDKPFSYDDQIVFRRYYSGIKRGDEVINVRDSVLLKSGTRKKDQPFVARVSGLWEEYGGPNAGEMMMSVFWYYRPEQTEMGRQANLHGEVRKLVGQMNHWMQNKAVVYNGTPVLMEVMASRHKDDNSIACIVDKCYVLAYPEYCRFRAQSILFQESRVTPLSPVPPGESTRPGSVPKLNTDPLLVFFCRQVYDYKMGRIIKNPV